MRRSIACFTLLLLLWGAMTVPASAQLLAGAQLGYGKVNLKEILGDQKGLQTNQWSTTAWAHYDHEDLRFTGLYQGSTAFSQSQANQHLAQAAANFRFMEEGPMQIYGGLGYQFLSTSLPHPTQEGKFSFTGHGFVGQVILDLEILPELRSIISVTTNPWMTWTYGKGGSTQSVGRSSTTFNAKLDLFYDLNEELGVQVGLSAGSYKVPEFAGGETRGAYSALNVGVTHRF